MMSFRFGVLIYRCNSFSSFAYICKYSVYAIYKRWGRGYRRQNFLGVAWGAVWRSGRIFWGAGASLSHISPRLKKQGAHTQDVVQGLKQIE